MREGRGRLILSCGRDGRKWVWKPGIIHSSIPTNPPFLPPSPGKHQQASSRKKKNKYASFSQVGEGKDPLEEAMLRVGREGRREGGRKGGRGGRAVITLSTNIF